MHLLFAPHRSQIATFVVKSVLRHGLRVFDPEFFVLARGQTREAFELPAGPFGHSKLHAKACGNNPQNSGERLHVSHLNHAYHARESF